MSKIKALKATFRFVAFLKVAVLIPFLSSHAQILGGDRYNHNELVIHTIDNARIKGRLFENDNNKVMVYCHRLLGSQSGEEVQELLEAFIDEYDLITFNFRGHKSSSMNSTTGGNEILDLRAVLSFAKKRGYYKTVVIGSGMGGIVAIRSAGIFRNIDALVIVSPSGLSPEVQPFLVKLAADITLGTDFGRVPLRIFADTRLGTRYTAGYPADILDAVSSIPLLVIQSETDQFVNLDKIRSVFGGASEPNKLIVVPGSRHADKLFVKSILSEIGNWLKEVVPENSDTFDPVLEEGSVDSARDSVSPKIGAS